MLSGRNDGTQFTGLYVFHQPIDLSFNENFYLYYGLGGHIGYEKFDDIAKILNDETGTSFLYEKKSFFVMGANLYLGIEYRWLTVPMTVSFDLKPYINFIGMRHLREKFWDAGVSFKYIF